MQDVSISDNFIIVLSNFFLFFSHNVYNKNKMFNLFLFYNNGITDFSVGIEKSNIKFTPPPAPRWRLVYS